jgi:CBF/Mak21 family
MAFIQRREYSNVRIVAFMKQILTLTLHCASSTDMSIPLLAFVRQLIQRYLSSLQQLYENEQDVITEGQYRMDVMDPEHANPLCHICMGMCPTKISLQYQCPNTGHECRDV